MDTFDLLTGAAHLRDATEQLQLAWRLTAEHWDDPVSRKFCRQFLEPIGPCVKTGLNAIGQMNLLIQQMQQECET